MLVRDALDPHPAVVDPSELGFEQGAVGATPHGWSVPTPGWKAELTEEKAAVGTRSAKLLFSAASEGPFGKLMQSTPAAEFAGWHVMLSARSQVAGAGRGSMWLRIDGGTGTAGAFDNMDDRPILRAAWMDAIIEADAAALNVGFLAIGGATLSIDDVRLTA